MQLCHPAFAGVLFEDDPNVPTLNEHFIFEPLVKLGHSAKLDRFDVEVDWLSGDEERGNWDDREDLPFSLRRTDTGIRRWCVESSMYLFDIISHRWPEIYPKTPSRSSARALT